MRFLDLDILLKAASIFLASAVLAAFMGFAAVDGSVAAVAKFLFFQLVAICVVLVLVGLFIGRSKHS